MHEHDIIALAAIGLVGFACQWLAWAVRLPAILFLLLAGIVAGPVTGWLHPDELFGELLFPLVSLSVAVILFEGALTLRFEEIRGLGSVVRNMVTVGVLTTWAIVAVATHYLVGFAWPLAILFGAVMVVTGPTVIVPMLRTVRPTAAIGNVLRWEGIVIDPIGALLAVLVYQFIVSGIGREAIGENLLDFGATLAIGLLLGAASGYAVGVALRRHWLPEYLHALGVLAVLIAVFAASNALKEESGLLTVTVMGMWLANMRGVHVHDILDFKESLSLLLISGLFIILAARMDPGDFQQLGWGALGVFLVIQFVARPVKVLVSTWGSKLTFNERALLAWIAPRGIVAAAVAALFALRLEEGASPEAAEQIRLLVPLTFAVIIGTVVLQSATAGPLARLLKVAEPEPKGLLLVGANAVARAIGLALREQGLRVLLTDTVWSNLQKARLAGLDVYYGNPVSEHADRHLNLVGIGRMLALSPYGELNALASIKYQGELGRDKVYTLQTPEDDVLPEQLRIGESHRGYTLFGEGVTYGSLAEGLATGARIRATTLTEAFGLEDYHREHGGQAVPLFALRPGGKLEVIVAGSELKPGPGWTIVALLPPAAEPAPVDEDGDLDGEAANGG